MLGLGRDRFDQVPEQEEDLKALPVKGEGSQDAGQEAEKRGAHGEECRSDAEAIEVSDAAEEDPHSTCLGVADRIVS